MKRFYTYFFSALMLTMSALTLTSCSDEDLDRAMALSGGWTGDFGMYYEIQDPYGQWYAFDASRTDLVFYPQYEYATYGEGKQVDSYDYGPYRQQYYYFRWEVHNGTIYLDYPYDPDLNVAIRDYRMTSSTFKGWIGDMRFTLYKISGLYDWSGYSGNHAFWEYDDYYWYGKSREGKSEESFDGSQLNIRRGNRFNEKQQQ